jgi:hypothetical protein
MLVLDTTDTIRITLDAAINVDYSTHYVDTSVDAAAVNKGTYGTATTPQAIVAAPTAGKRIVKSMYINNRGASPVGVIVDLYNGATAYRLRNVVLQVNDTLAFDENGVNILTANPISSAASWMYENLADNGGFHWADYQVPGTDTTITTERCNANRWRAIHENASVQYSRQDGFAESGITAKYFGRYTKITSTGKLFVIQTLKHSRIAAYRGRTMHLQVKMKASGIKTIRMGVLEAQNAGTADGAPVTSALIPTVFGANTADPTWQTNLALITPTAVSNTTIRNTGGDCAVTTSWQTFSINVTIPSNSKNLCIAIWTDSQFAAADTLSITEVDFFLGTTDRIWNPTAIPLDRLRCSEFCYVPGIQEDGTLVAGANTPIVGSGVTNGTTSGNFTVQLPCPGFKTPTVTATGSQWLVLDGTTNPAATAITVSLFSGTAFRVDAACTCTASRGAILIADATGGRRLVFDMEFKNS